MNNLVANTLDHSIYPIEVRKKDGLFYLICKNFKIVESGISMDNAYEKILIKRQQICDQLYPHGIDLTQPDIAAKNNYDSSMLHKTMQVSIIFMCLIFPISISMSAVLLLSKVSNITTAVTKKFRAQIGSLVANPSQISSALIVVSEKLDSVTPERKEELQLALRKIVRFSSPLVSELHNIADEKK